MIFFTSDTHFAHERIIEYNGRPFKNIEAMNSALIANWNAAVSPDDTVYHLGDFCLGERKEWERFRYALNGNIHLILGNHDLKASERGHCGALFESVKHANVVNIDGVRVFLSHYPYLCFDGEHGSSVQLFGHVHSGPHQEGKSKSYDIPRLKYLWPTQYDVGVDNNNFTPISWEQIKTKLNPQKRNS